jgi:hypothetical protein
MNVAILWDIAPFGPYGIRFGGTYHLYLQGRKSAEQETSVIAAAQPPALLLDWFPTFKMEAISTSEVIHIRITQRYVPQHGNIRDYLILH